MDFLLGLITGYLLNWMALSALVLLAIFCEAIESTGIALFLAVVAATVAYMLYPVPLQYVLYGSAAYALIGVAWSLWRYRRFVREKVPEAFSESALHALAPGRNAGRIVHWMVVWPVSMASNVVGDVLVLAKSIVTKWLRGLYESIYQGAVSSAKKDAA